ncbi:hypothetical protein P171DRAFT_435441 [Karstenula rhodostoma CBS 690.94]|uniref:RING-type domain-containing protein n=1 Tax=Karstenula rhodostoma CBS 690.94 TaxID=1392251 RepID=A0A9P4P931_9PLEO|nr:hypothetical protein P171DRAFT_435441 [Karstenula rhodostoma CBS 690.94]
MATDHPEEVYDLLLLVDATSSMSNYLESLRITFPKIISISKLTNSFARIGLLAYRDYSEADNRYYPLLEWSGWYSHDNVGDVDSTTAEGLMQKAGSLVASGGGDFPEATKTGLARAYSLMREDATTIILLYTDATPQCWTVAEKDPRSNYVAEQKALKHQNSYDGFGPHFADWVEGCNFMHAGPRKAHVFCFLDEEMGKNVLDSGFYLYLSTITRGACMYLTESDPHSIAHVTVDVLLSWMGVAKPGAGKTVLPATLIRYKLGADIKKIKDEKDPIASPFFWSHDSTIMERGHNQGSNYHIRMQAKKRLEPNQVGKLVDSAVLARFLPKRKTKVLDFARRYSEDAQYRAIVIEELRNIIGSDVTSIALNPVFGSLWRAVCNDRTFLGRQELTTVFASSIDKLQDSEQRIRMKNWLEESYDFAADILDTLEAVPEDQRFPCVFLDPTIRFRPAKEKGEKLNDEEDEDNRQITAFRRDELLDIGRSCEGRILRRLGNVLTRLTYVKSAEDLPLHIAATPMAEVPKIPVALASQSQEWKFWKILLHAVLPGTMLSTRPSMVLAALAIRIGIEPLFPPASSALKFWRDKWSNLEAPETWTVGCLGLLLDADDEYRKMTSDSEPSPNDSPGLLLSTDRALFTQLVAHKLAEVNFQTTLVANISWTPEKTQLPVGHVVTCRRCKHPRSVTIMAPKSGGQCGLCVASDYKDDAHKERMMKSNITDCGNLAWVECSVRTCRAQYVCYNPEDLNVRPKCYYCRCNQGAAPTLECSKCRSKVLWPREWQVEASTPFNCVACIDGHKTVVSVDTTTEELCKQNGQAWLLRNDNNTLKKPFQGSVFRTITTVDSEAFLANVGILPAYDGVLTLRGKPIQNQAALTSALSTWIHRRDIEKTPCSLCFSELPNARLFPACRRRGCHQSICERCLSDWYGQNSVGQIINPAALFCPFCRRPPAARTLAAYGRGIHAVGDLMIALKEKGKWIHIWCRTCGKARRYMERECARGAPEPVDQSSCEECKLEALENARRAEEEARRAAAEAAQLAHQLNVAERRERIIQAQWELSVAERARAELEYPVKKCPGCGVRSQKSYGCDHVQCPIKTCGVHWCWSCTKIFTQRNIYGHMSQAHGGWDAEGAWGGVRYRMGFENDEDDYDEYYDEPEN